MNMQLLLGLWVVIFLAYATVALLRWKLGQREDDHIHFADYEQGQLSAQTTVAHKLDVLDRWKTALLVLTIVSALIIGGLHVYYFWLQTTTTPQFS
jgi:hypothetical protein